MNLFWRGPYATGPRILRLAVLFNTIAFVNDKNNPDKKRCLCPDIEYGEWDNRHVSFDKKRFLPRPIPQAFYLPVGLPDEIKALLEKARKLKLVLSRPTMLLKKNLGFFKGELLLGIETDIGPEESILLSGKYLTKLCRGPYDKIGREKKEFEKNIGKELGIKPGEILTWYVNCPECWNEKGGPAAILLARIGNPDVVK